MLTQVVSNNNKQDVRLPRKNFQTRWSKVPAKSILTVCILGIRGTRADFLRLSNVSIFLASFVESLVICLGYFLNIYSPGTRKKLQGATGSITLQTEMFKHFYSNDNGL